MNESDSERINREKREALNQMMKYLVLLSADQFNHLNHK